MIPVEIQIDLDAYVYMLDMLNLDRYVMVETASSTAVTVMKL